MRKFTSDDVGREAIAVDRGDLMADNSGKDGHGNVLFGSTWFRRQHSGGRWECASEDTMFGHPETCRALYGDSPEGTVE